MSLRILRTDAVSIRAYGPALAELERSITYPIGDGEDRFFIDHGDDYGAFFGTMGLAGYLVVLDGDEVVGLIAGARKEVRVPGGGVRRAFYIGDLKLAPSARGRHVVERLLAIGLKHLVTDAELRDWDFVFGAMMRGERGDFRRTVRSRWHLGHLGRPMATLRLFFEPAERLGMVSGDGPRVERPGLDLSHGLSSGPAVVRNTGRKDFRLLSTGKPWKLAHLCVPPDRWDRGLGAMLRHAAGAIEPDELGCLAIDERLTESLDWLAEQGLTSSTVCTVIGMPHPWFGWRSYAGAEWIHLSPAEI